ESDIEAGDEAARGRRSSSVAIRVRLDGRLASLGCAAPLSFLALCTPFLVAQIRLPLLALQPRIRMLIAGSFVGFLAHGVDVHGTPGAVGAVIERCRRAGFVVQGFE